MPSPKLVKVWRPRPAEGAGVVDEFAAYKPDEQVIWILVGEGMRVPGHWVGWMKRSGWNGLDEIPEEFIQ